MHGRQPGAPALMAAVLLLMVEPHLLVVMRDRAENLPLTNRPYFDNVSMRNTTTVQVGAHAYLTCYVGNLGNRSVSWIRSRDNHILTVDKETFISDNRFVSLNRPPSTVWTLQIR